ncbi:ribonuclease T2 family protein [Roseibium polysiphoniae]|uniref:Ribonuclease T2 n=1 Tax=Roseibium polysiphoniae TaxID=2571221 RepID=A0ABR9C960_9HYPH|nr:ribonuclease T2 [Roseibium polysiphoniae]MBD8876113.1 ribonuclease T2 [Roseibium polysiphoniae]
MTRRFSGPPEKRLARLVLAVLLLVGGPVQGAQAEGSSGDFDYYVLALSWSPTYCARQGRNAEPLQCQASKPHRFIVHGLWPQYERGWPDFCRTRNDRPSRHTVSEILDIMPSRGLVSHQWRKHGTCSGLDPEAYFDTIRAAYDKIRIPATFRTLERTGRIAPDGVEKAFRLANPGLGDAAMAVTCSKGALQEVKICLTKDLEFRSCRAVDRSGCRASKISVSPPLRR